LPGGVSRGLVRSIGTNGAALLRGKEWYAKANLANKDASVTLAPGQTITLEITGTGRPNNSPK
jgi:hypothetical protein